MSQLRLKVPQAGEPATADNFDPGGNVGDVLTKLAPPSPGLPPDYGWRPGGGGVPLPTISAQVFVSALFGSDTTGNGSQTRPYATIGHAQATILDASATKVYQIWVMPGAYTENVGLMAWTILNGTDMSDNQAAFMQANVIGNFTLGPSFTGAILGEQAWVTNIDVNGLLTLDYVAAGSTNGSCIFTNCQLEADALLTATGNTTEFHICNVFGNLTQVGGFVELHNTNGVNPGALLLLQAPPPAGVAFLDAWGGSWSGSVTLDQNASVGQAVLRGRSFDMSNGAAQILASATNSPAFVSAHGDLPENCNISGGAAAVMSPQMRISHQFTDIAPNPTAIAGMAAGPPAGPPFAAVTTISLVVPAGLIGATPIETMHCSCAPVGANWGTFIGPHNCSVTVTYRTNGGIPNVDVNISNPGAAFNIVDLIDLNFSAYLPLVL